MEKVIIYGGGGHAKVIIDIVHQSGEYEIVGVFDDDVSRKAKALLGVEVLGAFPQFSEVYDGTTGLIIGIGDNTARHRVWEKLQSLPIRYVRAVHPSAVIGHEVELGEGAVVMAGAVINCCSKLGAHSIANTRSSIGHDCHVGDFVHIAPGVVLCGGVRVGRTSLVGAGAVVLPGVTIGRNVVVGGGAVATRDVPDGACVVGVPAKPLNRSREA